MKQYDLSILIPARNEEYLYKTVQEILEKKRGKTEIIINLDGAWADPPIPDHPDITIIYNNFSLGQRGGTNQACRLSRAKYVMKADAHLAYDEGFDVKLMSEMKDHYTMVPRMYNLHVFEWKCNKCGKRWYQSPTPTYCRKDYEDPKKERNPLCDNTTDFTKEIIWKPRWHKRTDFMRFDNTLHFQYWGDFKNRPEAQPDIAPTMSLVGACWMVTRERYWALNMSDERHGSWGQQGTEVACKTWLSGGELVVNKKTWYAHLFRTQGGDFGFPYPNPGEQIENARRYSRELWFNNKFEGQIHPLSYLLEKFWPVRGWNEEDLAEARMKAEEFYQRTGNKKPLTKGLIYYTDNQLNIKISNAVKKQLKKIGLPIVSTSLKPIDFGKNIVLGDMKRGWKAYFKQILTALENSTADIIYFTEHDWLYHPSHFEFTPERKDTFYYNWNWWRVRSSDGKAVHYDTQLLPAIVAYRELFLEYYRKQIKLLEENNWEPDFIYKTGFEPATHNRIPELSGYKKERFDSTFPNIDIRHDNNLTSSKWSQDAFRSPKNAKNWKETEEIPGWGLVKDNFVGLLKSI